MPAEPSQKPPSLFVTLLLFCAGVGTGCVCMGAVAVLSGMVGALAWPLGVLCAGLGLAATLLLSRKLWTTGARPLAAGVIAGLALPILLFGVCYYALN